MTDEEVEKIWNALHLGKMRNMQAYERTSHIEGAKELYLSVEGEIEAAMTLLRSTPPTGDEVAEAREADLLDMLEDAHRLWIEADPNASETVEAQAIARALSDTQDGEGDA